MDMDIDKGTGTDNLIWTTLTDYLQKLESVESGKL